MIEFNCVAVAPLLSVILMLKLKGPALVVVPLILFVVEVDEPSDIPLGRAPAGIDQV